MVQRMVKRNTNQDGHPEVTVLHVDVLEGGNSEVDPRHDAPLQHSTFQVHTFQIGSAASRILWNNNDTRSNIKEDLLKEGCMKNSQISRRKRISSKRAV